SGASRMRPPISCANMSGSHGPPTRQTRLSLPDIPLAQPSIGVRQNARDHAAESSCGTRVNELDSYTNPAAFVDLSGRLHRMRTCFARFSIFSALAAFAIGLPISAAASGSGGTQTLNTVNVDSSS